MEVNLSRSCVASGIVDTLSHHQSDEKAEQGVAELYTRQLPEGEWHHVVAWSDARWANRKDGKPQKII